MEKPRYHVFYTWAYGMDHHYEVFDDLPPVLVLVKKARDEPSLYREFRVIWGRGLEFEPATVIETYKIKQT